MVDPKSRSRTREQEERPNPMDPAVPDHPFFTMAGLYVSSLTIILITKWVLIPLTSPLAAYPAYLLSIALNLAAAAIALRIIYLTFKQRLHERGAPER